MVTTNFLKFCSIGSGDGMAFASAEGASSSAKGCVAGRVYTRSGESVSGIGLFVTWAVDFWGSSISSCPLPSSVSIGEVSSF